MESSRTPPPEPSAAELVKQVSEQTQRLIRQELALARLELTEKAKHAGIGAGMLAAAGLVALLALAGVLALVGKGQLGKATPAAPQTVESVKADVEEVRTHAHT